VRDFGASVRGGRLELHTGTKAERTLVERTPSPSVVWGECGLIIGDTLVHAGVIPFRRMPS
jgi:hypothetical protein